MPYRKATLQAGEYYHIYNRGNNRQPIFYEQENYFFFLQRLKEYTKKLNVVVIAYCLMPTHFHLLICPSLDNLSEMMRSLSISYSKAMNKRYNRVGTLFQGQFRTVHIDRDEYLLHLSRYIHLNPVKASLVKLPEDWQYSSYLEFIGKRQGSLPKPDIILRQFSCLDEYRAFVDSGINVEDKTIDHLVLEN